MAVTDLPEPDSPTIENTSPRCTSKVTPSTARTTPSSVVNLAWRSRTESSSSREPGVERRHFSFGSSASRRPSPTNTKARTVRKMAMPGKNSRCGAVGEDALALGHHQAPRRGGVLRARPRGTTAPPRTRITRADGDGAVDDDRLEGVGEDVAEHDPPLRVAERRGRLHVLELLQGQEARSHDAADAEPAGEAEHEDHRVLARPRTEAMATASTM